MITLSIIFILLLIDISVFCNDRYIWSFLMFVAMGIGAWYMIPAAQTLYQSVGLINAIVYGIPMWIVIGSIIAALKWLMHCNTVSTKIADYRQNWEKTFRLVSPENRRNAGGQYVISDLSDQAYKRFQFFCSVRTIVPTKTGTTDINWEDPNCLIDALTPRAKEEISRITFWILQWPITVLAFVLEDIVLKLTKNIASMFDAMFNKFSRMMIGKAVEGL